MKICTGKYRIKGCTGRPDEIEKIENHEINYNALNNLAYGQWTLKEIASGEAWEFLSKQNKY